MTTLLHQRLSDAGRVGDMDDLYAVLEQDLGVLEVEIVKQLLKVDTYLDQLQGREKRTLLHCAAMEGSIEVLDELIFNGNNSFRKLTVRKETVLHLALKHGQLETVKALLRWIEELEMKNLLSKKDLATLYCTLQPP
ncbi:hypothetical protein NE237_013575 [Protea cynaroides]|uniref:Uncharacterized protein n=1 Tax=Protea cynaroides TaxID=273540 RepID=A0A9Q0JZ43_9MAGN|nr:hypothetical protein NE237_013575 [Protea cynaroides]